MKTYYQDVQRYPLDSVFYDPNLGRRPRWPYDPDFPYPGRPGPPWGPDYPNGPLFL